MVDLAPQSIAQGAVRHLERRLKPLLVAGVIMVFAALVLRFDGFAALRVWPVAWTIPVDQWVNQVIDYIAQEPLFGGPSLKAISRATVPVLGAPVHAASIVLYDGYAAGFGSQRQEIIPPLSWFGVGATLTLAGAWVGGSRLAIGSLLTVAFLLSFGLWHSAMVTLSQLVVAVPCSGLLGLAGGIFLHRHPRYQSPALVILDLAQTVPIFSYLVPIIIFFGLGDVPSLIAIIIFASPPMVRMTLIGLGKAEADAGELATSIGCTRSQALWNVILPSASEALRLGFNQVVMLSFSTVILTSLVGAGGLGYDVLAALQQLAIGRGLEAGLAITLLAVILDRFMANLSAKSKQPSRTRASLFWVAAAFLLIVPTVLGYAVPTLIHYPDSWTLSSAQVTDRIVDTIVDLTYDPLQSLQTFLVLYVFAPMKTLLLATPWSFVVLAVFGLALIADGWRLAFTLALPVSMIAWTGLWEKAAVTAFLCAGGVLLSLVIGLPLGVLSGRVPMVRRVVRPSVDTLQTLPAFIYLIPVVMLLGNGDLPCIVAIASFAICPAIRYSEAAILSVPSDLLEAGRQLGLTSWQQLLKVEFPVARPHLLLAASQTVLMALAMVVVTALIGSTDLGHETIFAISKANPGRALVAGLAIATIGSVADRLLTAFAGRSRSISRGIEA